MEKPIVNIALPDFTKFNRVLIDQDVGILNDLNFINNVTKQEASLLGVSLEVNANPSYEILEGSDISDNVFDTFIPRDIQGVDELTDYMFYQNKLD